MDPSLSFHKHCNYVSDRIDNRNNMLKALAGSSWGQDKETLLMTYNALGESITNYAAPVLSTNPSDSSFKKIQTAHNAALRTATGAHKMASIDHLHQESLTLRVKDHMFSAQYLVNCLEEDHVSHGITTQEPRPMKETHSRHHSTVLPRLGSNRMESHQILHTHAGRFSYSTPRKQQSTEEASTPNIGRGAEIQPKTTMHSLTTTVSFTTRCETPVRLAISTTETLTDLKMDLVVANNNRHKNKHAPYTYNVIHLSSLGI